MKLKAKVIWLLLVVATPALVMCIILVREGKGMPHESSNGMVPHSHPGKERMVATLKVESLDQSIKLLIDDKEQYFFPFARSANISEDLQDDLERMLSARRFAKVLQEIKKLPKSKGDAECESLFFRGFQIHTNVCRAIIRTATDPSFTNHESILGTRMGMAAAMFIAADTARLDVLQREFVTLDQWRTEIEPLAKQQDRRFVGRVYVPALSDHVITPDLHLQVNVLRIAALRSGNAKMLKDVDEACASIQMKSKTFPLVAWNAKTTAYELALDSPLDTSKGITEYTFYDWDD